VERAIGRRASRTRNAAKGLAFLLNQAPHRHRQAKSGTCRGREPPHGRHTFEVPPPETRQAQDRPFRAESWCESDDPAFAAKAADIVRLNGGATGDLARIFRRARLRLVNCRTPAAEISVDDVWRRSGLSMVKSVWPFCVQKVLDQQLFMRENVRKTHSAQSDFQPRRSQDRQRGAACIISRRARKSSWIYH
jgi:hypothetical protein